MGIELRTTPFGPPATAELNRLLGDLRGGDPLAAATVLVPTNYVGVATRRALAAASDRGLAGVAFSTIYRLAELLGAARLAGAGRRPISTPVLAAAVREVLLDEPGVFAGTRDHPATEKALIEAHRELSDLDDTALDLLSAQSPRAADVVRIHRAVADLVARDWYAEQDLLSAAAASVDAGAPVLDAVGPVVVHLPRSLTGPQRRFLHELGRTRTVSALVGITGDTEVDAAAVADTGLAGDLDAVIATLADVPLPRASHLISVSDADDEVRGVVRGVVDRARGGVPFDRMAVLYGSEKPYARLLHEQFSAAGIPFNGMALGSLGESLVGRTALALLALRDRDYHRADLFALLSAAPVRHGRRLAPVAGWERISRAAGVVRGARQWDQRLTVLLADRRAELEDTRRDPDLTARANALEREIALAESLWSFVAQLIQELEAADRTWSWSRRCVWMRGLLNRYLGGDSVRAEWPEHEREAADRMETILDRLATLDHVERNPSPSVFARTFELELDSGVVRQGRFGEGVVVGALAMGTALDLDSVWVLGMAEGLLPGRPRDDSLLPDRERGVTNGALRSRNDRLLDQRRHYLAALSAAPGASTILFPRGDLRRSNERMPSRWFLESATAHEGRPMFTPDMAGLVEREWFTEIPSQVAGLVASASPPTVHEYDVVSVLGSRRSGAPLDQSRLAQADIGFERGLELLTSVASPDFTRFDGNLAHLGLPSPADPDQVVSPTRLESWAVCPHAYLMRHVLRVEPVEVPEAVFSLGPLERGTLIHSALDAWLSEVVASGDDGGPWTAEHRSRLRAFGERECRRLEERGLVGGAVRWRFDKRVILADLDELITRDNERRAGAGVRALASELGFGLPDSDLGPLELPLSDGRTLRFRGSADRVEIDSSGEVVVLDYKTGSDRPYRALCEDDPDLAGTKLQLPIYAGVARREFGDPDRGVRAGYWFVTSKREFRMVELPLSRAVADRMDLVLSRIVDGIAGGVFPQHPEVESFKVFTPCRYCDPDELGTRDRRRDWERKAAAPELRSYVELADPDLANRLAEGKAGS